MNGSASPTREKSLHIAGFLARSISGRRSAGDRAGGVLEWPAACVRPGSASFSRWHCSRSSCGRRCPCSRPGRRARARPPLSDRIESEAQADRRQEGPRARALLDDHALQPPHQLAAGRHHRAAAQAGPIQGDLDAKRAELARIQEDLRQERVRLARLRSPARRGADRARRPPRPALQGRQARRRDRRARVRRLRRPAAAHGVHAARLRPGRAHHRPRPHRARRGEASPRRGSTSSRSARRRSPPRSRRAATRSRASRASSSTAATRSPRCARTSRRRSPARARPASTSRATSRRWRRENARVQAQLAAAQNGTAPGAAGPIRPGSGGLVWPVNGPIVSPFGMRWGRLHAGVDIAVPAGTPIRAAQSGRVILLGWTGGYGNYTCIGHGGGLSTCYAHQSSLRDLERRERQPRPGHRLRRLHRPLLRRPPALRDAHGRRAGQPGRLPLTLDQGSDPYLRVATPLG